MTASVLPVQVFEVPAHWRTLEFISDVHLHDKSPATFSAWQRYMNETTADAVFILGDLFEVWIGDDAVAHQAFLMQCAEVLQQAAQTKHVAFMRGNRDFLVGSQFLNACHVMDLTDPTVLQWGTTRWLLSHGDEGCTNDVDYQVFRRMVRSTAWQQNFLAKPLAEREHIAREMRSQSESRKQDASNFYADVDANWTQTALAKSHSDMLLHGHTHQPADHCLGQSQTIQRRVLSDWDLDAATPRAEILRWHASGQVERINLTRS